MSAREASLTFTGVAVQALLNLTWVVVKALPSLVDVAVPAAAVFEAACGIPAAIVR